MQGYHHFGDNGLVIKARTKVTKARSGGIDLTEANIGLQTQNSGNEIKFHMDQAMMEELKNARGFVPVIINIQPLKNLAEFLGE